MRQFDPSAFADIIETNMRSTALEVAKRAQDIGYAQGVEAGRVQGFETGRAFGFVEAANALVPAVSDGLRHGSPECGRALQALRAMRAIPANNTTNATDGLVEHDDEEDDAYDSADDSDRDEQGG